MARGLSDLQKRILNLAYERRMCGEKIGPCDVCTTQVLLEIYDWPLVENCFSIAAHNFDRNEVGKQEYDQAMVTVSRALKRLEARGLVSRFKSHRAWSGISLTPAGFQVAEELLVK
jgi:hypothetical protein